MTTTTNWYYNNNNDITLITEDMLKYATIKADDCCTGISNLMSACGISFDEAAESVLKLQESFRDLSDRVAINEGSHYHLKDKVSSAISSIDCSSSRIYSLEEAIEKLTDQIKELQSQLRPGTAERTVRPKQKSDLEIFCRDVLNMEMPNFDKYFTLIDFSE